MQGQGWAVLRLKSDPLCVFFLPILAHRPRGLCAGAACVEALARVSVSPSRVVRRTRGPHGDISRCAGAENAGQAQLDAANAERIWRRRMETGSEKTEADQGFMQPSRPR